MLQLELVNVINCLLKLQVATLLVVTNFLATEGKLEVLCLLSLGFVLHNGARWTEGPGCVF